MSGDLNLHEGATLHPSLATRDILIAAWCARNCERKALPERINALLKAVSNSSSARGPFGFKVTTAADPFGSGRCLLFRKWTGSEFASLEQIDRC
jgi:hypothetical protein